MPLYDFSCDDCGEWEAIVKYDVRTLKCPHCEKDARRKICMPTRTSSSWGDTQWGINGKYDSGLGTRITSYSQQDKLLRERGLIRESDFGTHFYADYTQKQKNEKKRLDNIANQYHQAVLSHGDDPERHVKAATETFPAQQMLDEAAAAESTTNTGI